MILHEAKPAAEDVPALENAAPEDGEAIVPRALGPRHLCHTILYMYIHVYTCIFYLYLYIYIKGFSVKASLLPLQARAFTKCHDSTKTG